MPHDARLHNDPAMGRAEGKCGCGGPPSAERVRLASWARPKPCSGVAGSARGAHDLADKGQRPTRATAGIADPSRLDADLVIARSHRVIASADALLLARKCLSRQDNRA